MRSRARFFLLTTAAVGIGLLLRLSTRSEVRSGSRAVPISSDCVYHLRRARFAVGSFPRTIVFDPVLNAPAGAICIWPPLFDASLALPALLLGGPRASLDELERSAMVVPLFFAAGAIFAAGLAGQALRRCGGAAALFVAVCVGHIHYSQFGHTDQHVAESCFGFLVAAFAILSFRRRSPVLELSTGAALAAAVLTWQGAIFWVPLLSFSLCVDSFSKRRTDALARSIRMLGLPAAAVAAATAFWLNGLKVPFTYISFGWFQPVFLSLGFAAASAAAALSPGSRISRSERFAAALLAFVAIAPTFVIGGAVFRGIASGIAHLSSSSRGSAIVLGGFLSYPREWLSQIAEYRPLLADGWGFAAGVLSLSFFLSPLALLLWTRRAWRGPNPALHSFLAAWGLFTFATTLLQRRNMYYAALLSALTCVELSAWLAVALSRRKRPRRRRLLRSLSYAAVALMLSVPMLAAIPAELSRRYRPGSDLLESLEALRHIAHPGAGPEEARLPLPPAVPAASHREPIVLAPWSLGHFLTYYAEVPVVADNFGYGFDDSVRFFLSDSEAEALDIVRRRNVRYVFCADLVPKMDDYARILGRPGYTVAGESGPRLTRAYFDTLQSRLYDFDGADLKHFRLVYSSRTGTRRFGRFVAQWKIFEVDSD